MAVSLLEFFNPGITPEKFFDPHVHTTDSDGLSTPEEIVIQAEITNNLDAIAITDHEVISGAEKALNYAIQKGYRIKIIIGEEITTQNGHLLGLFLKNIIPSGKSLEYTLYEIHKQGGLAVIPHPLYFLTSSLTGRSIQRIIEMRDPEIFFDGFEIYNAAVARIPRLPLLEFNNQAKDYYLANRHDLGAALGGSDAHYWKVGMGLTGYTGDLYEAIKKGETSVNYTSENDRISLANFLEQSYKGIIVEPGRRIKRRSQKE